MPAAVVESFAIAFDIIKPQRNQAAAAKTENPRAETENSHVKKLGSAVSSHEKRQNRQNWKPSCEETAESIFFTRKTPKQAKLKILVRRNCGIDFLHTKNAKTGKTEKSRAKKLRNRVSSHEKRKNRQN